VTHKKLFVQSDEALKKLDVPVFFVKKTSKRVLKTAPKNRYILINYLINLIKIYFLFTLNLIILIAI
jgi:hypothetical protein